MPLFDTGRGLNSIRWRFALASTLLTLAGIALRERLPAAWQQQAGGAATLVALALLAGAATYGMASRLTAQIEALKRSTEAIAAGDFDAPVEVDCACEVGGLATSFRKMTTRLNANVLRINTLAYTDAITGLPNRSVVDHLLGYALAPERAGRFRAAIVFIDLDGFKRINDTLGHDAGDEVLRLASRRILVQGLGRADGSTDTCMDPLGNPCDRLPEGVVFARFAGDEFVAILPDQSDRARLAEVGERIVTSLHEPFRVKGQDVRVGASVGIAITPEDTRDPAELLAFADLAMYSSKQAGKARYRFFDKQVREQMLAMTRTEAELRVALQRGELLLHYQPKVDLETLALEGVEALVRWQHPTRGFLGPGEFIDVAERSGLMAELGRQVLHLAVAQCRAWLDAGLRLNVSVNASPSQFGDEGFVPHVLHTLAATGVPPELLTIEITESMAMADFEVTAQRLAELRAARVRVALDDFGIGYSNLAQLLRLPLDVLKVDRSLVQGIGRDGRSEALIRAVVGMTRALGCRTVAEGIETEAQRRYLQALGCDCGQGYLFARPMPAVALVDWHCATPPPPPPYAMHI